MIEGLGKYTHNNATLAKNPSCDYGLKSLILLALFHLTIIFLI